MEIEQFLEMFWVPLLMGLFTILAYNTARKPIRERPDDLLKELELVSVSGAASSRYYSLALEDMNMISRVSTKYPGRGRPRISFVLTQDGISKLEELNNDP